MEQQTIVTVFDTPGEAEQALQALLQAGFSRSQARVGSAEGMDGGSSSESGSDSRASTHQTHHMTLGEKIAHFFGLDHDDDDTTATYSEVMRRGSSVVAVDVVDEQEAQRATSILGRYEPIDMDQRVSEWRASGWQPRTEADVGREREASDRMTSEQASEQRAIPVVEEQLQVGTRMVQSGGVRIFSRTRQIPVEERVRLREERATVTRRPVDRPVTDADRPFEEQSIEVRESREEPVVGKTARVVEEVVVGKETRQREENVRDNVRRTEVEVQRAAEDSDRERSRRQRD